MEVSGQMSNMFEDDVFEGWLSVPSMETLFAHPVQSTPNDASTDDPEPSFERPERAMSVHRASQAPTYTSVPGDTQASNDYVFMDPNNRKRRGHTKSRLGCLGCKKRKIKCQEQWPSCDNCIRRGCPCRYPTVFKHTQHDRFASNMLVNPRPFMRLSDTTKSSTFSANDMRLFHHFLVSAHPCIPEEYEAVWVRDVPTFSHQYDYLMHGILAMSASHLAVYLDDPPKMALVHRQKAIEGLSEAFARWPPQPHEAHVMLATSYLLAFQACYMPDAILDHVLSLRGCAMLSKMILSNRIEGAFVVDSNLHSLEPKSKDFPSLDQQIAREALHAMANFGPRLSSSKAHKVERAMIAQLVECVRPLLLPSDPTGALKSPSPGSNEVASEMTATDSRRPVFTFGAESPVTLVRNPMVTSKLALDFEEIVSWDTITDVPSDHKVDPCQSMNALMASLLILSTWPRENVLGLFSPSNVLGNIVMAYFCCIRLVVAPLAAPQASKKTPMKAMIEWGEKIVDAIEDDKDVKWTEYIAWPRTILNAMRCCLNKNRGLTFGGTCDIIINSPELFREKKPHGPEDS